MGIPYLTFMKHSEKVTKTASESRPVLKGVHHREDGTLCVSDSHRLYYAKNLYEGEEKLINPKTGAIIEGNYPDVSRLIPEDPKITIVIEDVKALLDASKVLQQAGTIPLTGDSKTKKSLVMFELNIEESEATFLTVDVGINATYSVGSPTDKQAEPFRIYFNAEYLIQALDLFKDAGVISATLNFFGNMRPFTLENEKAELTALILPIRRN